MTSGVAAVTVLAVVLAVAMATADGHAMASHNNLKVLKENERFEQKYMKDMSHEELKKDMSHKTLKKVMSQKTLKNAIGHKTLMKDMNHKALKKDISHTTLKDMSHKILKKDMRHKTLKKDMSHKTLKKDMRHKTLKKKLIHKTLKKDISRKTLKDMSHKTLNKDVSNDELKKLDRKKREVEKANLKFKLSESDSESELKYLNKPRKSRQADGQDSSGKSSSPDLLLKHAPAYMKEGRTLEERRQLKKLRLRVKRKAGDKEDTRTQTKGLLKGKHGWGGESLGMSEERYGGDTDFDGEKSRYVRDATAHVESPTLPWPWVDGTSTAEQCGQTRFGAQSRRHRGGAAIEALPGAFPWVVAILDSDRDLICGGTIIAPRWVLTAAHCISKTRLSVRLQEHHVREKDGYEIELKVRRIYRHPDYNSTTYDNDVALLLLPVLPEYLNPSTGMVAPGVIDRACLPTDDEDFPRVGTRCLVMGWGKANASHTSGTEVLMYTLLPIISRKACVASNRNAITENMFCAARYKGGADTCQGDSGGPLVCANRDNGQETWTLYGATSFGEGCGDAGKMGVYAKVTRYLNWIAEIMRRY